MITKWDSSIPQEKTETHLEVGIEGLGANRAAGNPCVHEGQGCGQGRSKLLQKQGA